MGESEDDSPWGRGRPARDVRSVATMTDITNEYRATRDGVAAVVVTFNPDLGRLRALLNATLPQVKRIYVVDNGSYSAVRSDVEACPGAAFLPLGRNLGLAAAQNVG